MTNKLVALFLFLAAVAFTNTTMAQDEAPPVVTTERADTPCMEAFQRELARLGEMSESCDPANVRQAFETVRQTCAGDFTRIQAWINDPANHCDPASLRDITRGGGSSGSSTSHSTPTPTSHSTTPIRYVCIDSAVPVQRHGRTIRCDCPDGLREVDVDYRTVRQELHHPNRTVVVTCTNPNPAAEREGRDHVDRDWGPIIARIDALELACDRPEEEMTPGWRELCQRVTDLETLTQRHEVQIRTIINRLDEIEPMVERMYEDEVPGIAEGACDIPADELRTLTREQIADRCRAARPHGGSNGGPDRWLNFQIGAGARLLLHTEMGVASIYGVAFAQWEPMIFSENTGLYVRGLIGYGTVGDQPGQYGQFALGESGIWGLAAGVAVRFDSHLALNVGVAFDSSLVEGPRGNAFGDYRWHTLGAEFRLRWNPVEIFALEFSLEPAWSHAEVELPNAPDLVGRDGFGLNGQIGAEFTF